MLDHLPLAKDWCLLEQVLAAPPSALQSSLLFSLLQQIIFIAHLFALNQILEAI